MPFQFASNLLFTKDKVTITGNEALLRDKPIWKAIFSLTIPSVPTILIKVIYNMADMFFIAMLTDPNGFHGSCTVKKFILSRKPNGVNVETCEKICALLMKIDRL